MVGESVLLNTYSSSHGGEMDLEGCDPRQRAFGIGRRGVAGETVVGCVTYDQIMYIYKHIS